MNDEALIAELRKAASIWFKNSDLLLLESLIRRYREQQEEIKRLRWQLENSAEITPF